MKLQPKTSHNTYMVIKKNRKRKPVYDVKLAEPIANSFKEESRRLAIELAEKLLELKPSIGVK